MKVAITGHRPERIKGYEKQIELWLEKQLKELKENNEYVVMLNGMAKGVDQMAALIAIGLDIPVECYFGYRHKLNPLEDYIADNAIGIHYQSEKYQKGCFTSRDRRMINDCDMILGVWDGKKSGGTYYTLDYARNSDKPYDIFICRGK